MKNILYFTISLLIISFLYAGQKRDMMIPDMLIKLIDGEQARLSSLLEDGPILVEFWATWCAPCKKEMIFLEEFHKKYSETGFRVLAISTDSPKSMSKVKSYIRAKKYSFLVGLDPNQEVAKKMNAMLMPTVVLIDSDRKVSWYHQGFVPGDEKEIEAQILKLLDLDHTKKSEK
jgi:thiol-disulfide isomerase/thioredoxin